MVKRDLLNFTKAAAIFTPKEEVLQAVSGDGNTGARSFEIMGALGRYLSEMGYEVSAVYKPKAGASGLSCSLKGLRLTLVCLPRDLHGTSEWQIRAWANESVEGNREFEQEVTRFLSSEAAALNRLAMDVRWTTFQEAERKG